MKTETKTHEFSPNVVAGRDGSPSFSDRISKQLELGKRGNFPDVLNDVRRAYSDCQERNERYGERELDFNAGVWLTRGEAYEVMSDVMDGYNNFEPSLILSFPEDSRIMIGREGSVCLYVNAGISEISARKELHVDEFDRAGHCYYRIWWD
jgi:hypothetical protein